MGWFWADTSPSSSRLTPPHPIREGIAPPPECPMHKASGGSMASSSNKSKPSTSSPSLASACPYQPDTTTATQQPSSPSPSYISKLNPLNYMPASISNVREAAQQAISLPLEREPSTIPRGDGTGNWEYPSPQQMYNAMLRKGYTDTPAEHVEAMVAVHNFLNEGAWEEIKGWEGRFAGGLGRGWEMCKQGEIGAAAQLAFEERRRQIRQGTADAGDPKLLRFMGRPSEPTPKARMLGFMAWIYPSQFPDNPPFDRHDWFVERQSPQGQKKEVRYVIDYYSGPPEPTGEPVFFLDVRPAVDGPTAACERLMRWGGDVWYRASGGSVREEMARPQRGR